MEEREMLVKARLLVEEMEERKRVNKLKYYRPHPKQLAFHRCDKRNRWVLGGNRTGKTEVGAAEAAWLARGNHPYKHIGRPVNGWIVSLTSEVQRDVAQKKFLSYINPAWIRGVRMREGRSDDPAGGVIDYLLIESVHGGVSTIGFKSCEQKRERFQGTSQDFVWFDEEPPYEVYQECLMRTLDCDGYIFGTMTPLMGLTWVYDVIFLNRAQDPRIWYETMTWDDNPYLPRDVVRQMEASLTPEELEARRDGRFVALTGLVYKEFREEVHVIDPFEVPREWQDRISIDPGLEAPLSAHWYAVDHDGCVYVTAEHYAAGLNVRQHMQEIERISRELDWKRNPQGHLEALMDAAADQHTLQSVKSVAELFRENGLMVDTRVNKSKWAGIQRVKQYLDLRESPGEDWPKGKPSLFIFRTCPMLISEIKQYRWSQNRTGGHEEPVKKDDHALDELRYYLMTRPEPHAQAPARDSPMLQHKKKLARRLSAPVRRH